jgi:hypothetical protein
MAWLNDWLRHYFPRKVRQTRQVRTFRPQLGDLETRVVPAAVGSNFIKHGGAVLGSPQVDLVFLGDAWNNNGALKSQIDNFAQYLLTSPFMTVLNQYGVNAGTVADSRIVPTSLGSRISTTQLDSLLTQDVDNGTLPAPGPNTLLFVLTPPNVTVADNPFGTPDFLGYHTSLLNNQGSQIAYAVVPYPGGTNPSDPGLTAFQSFTDTFSHELAEATTDPYVDLRGNPTGWDDYHYAFGDIYDGEVADIAENAPTVFLNNYAVTQLWSNAAGAVVSPADTTPTPAPSPLTLTGQSVANAVAGQPLTNAVLATISDTNANVTPGDLTATVQWGDGTSSNGTDVQVTTDANGNLVVEGTHTYGSSGTFHATVTVSDGSGDTATATSTISVAPAPAGLTVHALNITAQPTVAFSGPVATITDPSATSASDLTVTISWGDGSQSTGSDVMVSGPDAHGVFTVQGSHTYSTANTYSITVNVTDSGGATGSSQGTATVATPGTPGTLTVTADNVAAVTGQPFLATVATVSDPGASRHDLVARIDWGDGSFPSYVRLDGPDSQGNFTVAGWHNYAGSGNYTITVTVKDRETGASASNTATANVEDSGSLSVTAQRIETTAGTAFSGTIATGTAPAGATASDLTVTVDWGDGTPLDTGATATVDANGNLTVTGSHTYSSPGDHHFTVTVTDTATSNRAQDTAEADVDRATTAGDLHVTSVDVAATAGTSFTDGIAVVYAPGVAPGNLSVSVNWGDQTTDTSGSAGSNVQLIPFGTHGVTIVTGTHTYANPGSYTITVTVTNTATNATQSSSSSASVVAAGTTPTTPTVPDPTTLPLPPLPGPTPPTGTTVSDPTTTPTPCPTPTTPPTTTSSPTTAPTTSTPSTGDTTTATPTPTTPTTSSTRHGRHHHRTVRRASRRKG